MISNASDPALRPAHQPLRPTRLAALSFLSIVLAFGCGNDGPSSAGGTNGTGATNGGGAAGGNGAAPFSGAALCTVVVLPDGAGFFVRLVSDAELEAAEETGELVDSLEGAIEVGGGSACAVRGRSVFVNNFESPIITRFDEVDGALVERERVSFANLGLTSAATGALVIISDTKAYYLDGPTSQIVVWNPRDMAITGSIPLTVTDPPEGANQGFSVEPVDGLLFVWNRYATPEDLWFSRSDFWFIDTETDSVVATDTTEQCGNLGTSATIAANGDVYLCAIRIRTGTREVDTSYLADLNSLTGGLPTGELIPLGDDRVLLQAYDTSRMPIDPSLTPDEHLVLVNWDFYEWTLGTEQPAPRVESIPTGNSVRRALVGDVRARPWLDRLRPARTGERTRGGSVDRLRRNGPRGVGSGWLMCVWESLTLRHRHLAAFPVGLLLVTALVVLAVAQRPFIDEERPLIAARVGKGGHVLVDMLYRRPVEG